MTQGAFWRRPVEFGPAIKVCGVTRVADAIACAELGVDAIGLNLRSQSPRRVDRQLALEIVAAIPDGPARVGLFVNAHEEPALADWCAALGLDLIQLHGEEPAEILADLPLPALRAFRWRGSQQSIPEIESYINTAEQRAPGRLLAVLIDAHVAGRQGGTGAVWNWRELGEWRPPLPMILAGGLTCENVAEAVRRTHPAALDVASGVESAPALKDPELIAKFIAAAR